MDLEDKKIIRESLNVARENQETLIKMRRGQFFGNMARIFYWIIIVGASFGTYYFLQPYVDSLKNFYMSI